MYKLNKMQKKNTTKNNIRNNAKFNAVVRIYICDFKE